MQQNNSSLFIDVGSSSIKAYLLSNKKLTMYRHKSIPLKDGFNPEKGLSTSIKEDVFNTIESMKKEYSDFPLHVYSTALFRKMTSSTQAGFKKEFYSRIGVSFNIINHDEENEYLEYALLGRYNGPKPIMILNVGGGSTEIVIVQNGKTIERKNIDLGVGTINTQFPQLNKDYSGISLRDMIRELSKNLPVLSTKVDTAINTGGEFTYMTAAKYNLVKNQLFSDADHPLQAALADFDKKNEEIFSKLTLKELEQITPLNPIWMHGARAYLAFAQAIFETYHINTIIPSDSNLINGIVRKDFIK